MDHVARLDSIARGVDSYTRALRARHAISGQGAVNLESAFAKALDEIANELGLPL
ncbi:MAG: hypothetical protein V2A79_19890 [Planctomycetota bacterium]